MGLVFLDDVDHGVVEDPSSRVDEASLGDGALDLVSLDDGDLGVVDDPSSLVDEVTLGDGALDLVPLDDGLGVVEDPSSLVDEASLGDGARGVDLDQPHLELCFLRRNGVKTLSLTLRSAGFFFREAYS